MEEHEIVTMLQILLFKFGLEFTIICVVLLCVFLRAQYI